MKISELEEKINGVEVEVVFDLLNDFEGHSDCEETVETWNNIKNDLNDYDLRDYLKGVMFSIIEQKVNTVEEMYLLLEEYTV